ncbi:hypothetical protein PFISCL1PPCAC_23297, partial [Pristionchus fissidentatus]
STIKSFDAAQKLFTTPVELAGKSGSFKVDAVFQDTLPSGSHRGTVVTMHGSPGSHRVFKHVYSLLQAKEIRVVGVNFAGFGLSRDSDELQHTNEERAQFVQAIMESLQLRERVLFMAHSRG